MKNWLDKYKEEVPKAQKGKTIPATRQDSLDVYNNSLEVQRYFNNKEYKKISDTQFNSKNQKLYSLNDFDLFKVKNEYKKIKAVKKGILYGENKNNNINEKEYRKEIDKNKYYQRESASTILDLDSPMQLFDNRITPTKYIEYKNINNNSSLKGDIVTLTTYDPLSVKPFDLLTEKEKEQRVKQYGRDGVPKSYTSPKGKVEVKKPTQPVEAKQQYKVKPTQQYNKDTPQVDALNQLVPRGIQNNNFELEAQIPQIKQQVQAPKYYNVVDKVNQNFGGSETSYKWYPENGELPKQSDKLYEDGTPYNSRKLTPQYEDGGWLNKYENGGNIPVAQQGKNLKGVPNNYIPEGYNAEYADLKNPVEFPENSTLLDEVNIYPKHIQEQMEYEEYAKQHGDIREYNPDSKFSKIGQSMVAPFTAMTDLYQNGQVRDNLLSSIVENPKTANAYDAAYLGALGYAAAPVVASAVAPYASMIGTSATEMLGANLAGVTGLNAGNVLNAGFGAYGATHLPGNIQEGNYTDAAWNMVDIAGAIGPVVTGVSQGLKTASKNYKDLTELSNFSRQYNGKKNTLEKIRNTLNSSIPELITGNPYYDGHGLSKGINSLSTSNTDKIFKKTLDAHNSYLRGVSTNWDEIQKNLNRNYGEEQGVKMWDEIVNNFKTNNIDHINDPKSAAEYMATHVPAETGYGRVGLNQNVFNQNKDAIYTSNSMGTAEGYTYNDGYVVKVKRPTSYTGDRKDWINNNSNIEYYDETNNLLPNQGDVSNQLYKTSYDEIFSQDAINKTSKGKKYIQNIVKSNPEVYQKEKLLGEKLKEFKKDLGELDGIFSGNNKYRINLVKGDDGYIPEVYYSLMEATSKKEGLELVSNSIQRERINKSWDKIQMSDINDISNSEIALQYSLRNRPISEKDALELLQHHLDYNDLNKAYNYTTDDIQKTRELIKDYYNYDKHKISKEELSKIENVLNKLESKGYSFSDDSLGLLYNQKKEATQSAINHYENASIQWLNENNAGWDKSSNSYSHYLHIGNRGEKILDPVESFRVFNQDGHLSRAHKGSYTEGLSKLKQGGEIIKDDRGQWDHPGEITKIQGGNITMKNVNYPVLGISNTGEKQMMYPEQDYNFEGAEYVNEYPMMQSGGNIKNNTNFTKSKGWLNKYE